MGLRGSKLTTPRISLGEENPQIVEDPTPSEKPSKSTGLRGAKLTTPRISLGEENPQIVEDPTPLEKPSKNSKTTPSTCSMFYKKQ